MPMVNFLIFVQKNVYRIRFQNIKIGPLKGFEKRAFFSLLLMRKRLSSGQNWFLKPYFPLIRNTFKNVLAENHFAKKPLAERGGNGKSPKRILKKWVKKG